MTEVDSLLIEGIVPERAVTVQCMESRSCAPALLRHRVSSVRYDHHRQSPAFYAEEQQRPAPELPPRYEYLRRRHERLALGLPITRTNDFCNSAANGGPPAPASRANRVAGARIPRARRRARLARAAALGLRSQPH